MGGIVPHFIDQLLPMDVEKKIQDEICFNNTQLFNMSDNKDGFDSTISYLNVKCTSPNSDDSLKAKLGTIHIITTRQSTIFSNNSTFPGLKYESKIPADLHELK